MRRLVTSRLIWIYTVCIGSALACRIERNSLPYFVLEVEQLNLKGMTPESNEYIHKHENVRLTVEPGVGSLNPSSAT